LIAQELTTSAIAKRLALRQKTGHDDITAV
jgi:hypothetical protein